MNKRVKVVTKELEDFVVDVLQKHGMTATDAMVTADVMVSADKRGIESHGVARLKRYVDGIKTGIIKLDAKIETVVETPVSLLVDGGGHMGQVVAYRTMKRCIEKARQNFICLASIRNSNHYGIAGYYTQMALDEMMIGLSLTNSAPLVVPTFARNAVIGTNPISLGIPAQKEMDFLLDMATSTVPRGKLEVSARRGDKIPETWATDERGRPTTDAKKVLENLADRKGGGLLPIGGAGMDNGGHKGYGLGVLVDILSGVLSDGAVGLDVYGKKGEPAEVAHFLAAINPAAFAGLDPIREKMDYYIQMLKQVDYANGEDRVFVAGEKEYEFAEANKKVLTLQDKVFGILNDIGREFDLKLEEVI
jgi:LDH2 family malate/lactate/ureidoglycolate dehydrogenase